MNLIELSHSLSDVLGTLNMSKILICLLIFLGL